ncbi:hypothetical protein [Terrabacter sp. 2RAF25]|uniref:hypothetical protein n=1 Tax=Terrabacter sp. 2RAF25 TaxID=3232998 RepID=UPI003F991C44
MRYRGLGEVGLLVVSGAGLLLALTQTGSDPTMTLWWLAVVLVGVLLPGWTLVRAVRAGRVAATDLGWAGPTGLALALVTWLVAHLVGHSLPTLVVGPVVAAGLLAVPATRNRVLGRVGTEGDAAASWPAVAWASLAVLVLAAVRWLWVGGLALAPPKPTPTYELWNTDVLYQTALTGELRRQLVPGYPMVDGEPLGYHWFFHAVAAQLSGTGIDDLDIATRVLPATLVVLLLLLAAAVGQQVVGHWSGAVGAAAALAVVRPISVDTWVQPAITAVPNYWQLSPTATLGWVFGLALVGCLVAALRRAPSDRSAPAVLLPVFALGAAGAKSAQLPVIICGLGLAGVVVLAGEWRRRGHGQLSSVARTYLLQLGTLVVITVLAVLFLYPGSYGLRFDPAFWPRFEKSLVLGRANGSTAAEVAAVVVAFIRRWTPTLLPAFGLLVLVRRRPSEPAGWLGIGTLVGGILAALTFRHPSGSQYYFVIAALPIGYALSGAAVGGWVRDELAARRAGAMTESNEPAPPPVRATLTARWRDVRGRALISLAVAAGGLAVVLVVRRLLRSGGRRPAALAQPHSDGRALTAWFLPTAGLLVGLVLVVTLAWLIRRRSGVPVLRGTWIALLVLAAAAGGVRALAPALSPTKNPRVATSPAATTDAGRRPAVTPALFEAGQYLRLHADPSDVVATNRIYNGVSAAGKPDNRDFSVSALSGLRTDVGGYGYAPRMLQQDRPGQGYVVAPFWDQPRLHAELALITKPTAEALSAAYRTRGVRWIVADERSGPVSPQLATLTELVSHSDGVWLARLRAPSS